MCFHEENYESKMFTDVLIKTIFFKSYAWSQEDFANK